MKIKLHQKVVEIYNSKIQELLLQLKPEPKRKSAPRGVQSAKELYSVEISTDKIIDFEKEDFFKENNF